MEPNSFGPGFRTEGKFRIFPGRHAACRIPTHWTGQRWCGIFGIMALFIRGRMRMRVPLRRLTHTHTDVAVMGDMIATCLGLPHFSRTSQYPLRPSGSGFHGRMASGRATASRSLPHFRAGGRAGDVCLSCGKVI